MHNNGFKSRLCTITNFYDVSDLAFSTCYLSSSRNQYLMVAISMSILYNLSSIGFTRYNANLVVISLVGAELGPTHGNA